MKYKCIRHMIPDSGVLGKSPGHVFKRMKVGRVG